MDRTGIRSSYAIALFWLSALVALAVSVRIVTELVFIDFVHGNPNRPQSNALAMMALSPPIFSIIAIIGVWLIFGPAQLLQANATYMLIPRYGRSAFLIVALMLPIAGIVTWYSFDYLTPSDFNLGINEPADWTPYKHGISTTRFFKATMAQVVVTAFTFAYCNNGYFQLSHKRLLLGALIVTTLGGIAWGYGDAKVQYKFIDHPSQQP
jgi:hypothetical protein